MKSSSGSHLYPLDHMRAFAAFLVFQWHALHFAPATCRSFCYQDVFAPVSAFAALFEQGHTGVSLFMTLSGFIFAILTKDKQISLKGFWLNRALRLLPLLAFWSAVCVLIAWWGRDANAAQSFTLRDWLRSGIVPGSWSIVIELEFYALLPLILFFIRRSSWRVVLLIPALGVLARLISWHLHGSVQIPAYWTLLGRGDQFAFGIAAAYACAGLPDQIKRTRRLWLALGIGSLALLSLTLAQFSGIGGFYAYDGYPSASQWWVWLPAIEGLLYAAMIAAYLHLNRSTHANALPSLIGKWSYSIYLNHFFVAPIAIRLIAEQVGYPEGMFARMLWATLLAFPIVVASSALSYRLIEQPFLKWRVRYTS